MYIHPIPMQQLVLRKGLHAVEFELSPSLHRSVVGRELGLKINFLLRNVARLKIRMGGAGCQTTSNLRSPRPDEANIKVALSLGGTKMLFILLRQYKKYFLLVLAVILRTFKLYVLPTPLYHVMCV